MKVKVINDFRDKTADMKLRKVGEELTVSRERGQMLIDRQFAEEVKELPRDAE